LISVVSFAVIASGVVVFEDIGAHIFRVVGESLFSSVWQDEAIVQFRDLADHNTSLRQGLNANTSVVLGDKHIAESTGSVQAVAVNIHSRYIFFLPFSVMMSVVVVLSNVRRYWQVITLFSIVLSFTFLYAFVVLWWILSFQLQVSAGVQITSPDSLYFGFLEFWYVFYERNQLALTYMIPILFGVISSHIAQKLYMVFAQAIPREEQAASMEVIA
jgi:hypothetical protein